ncbi:AbrB family transcriptional regulator [Bacillus sp. V3-13]|uniref:AbrB/MazE/SpoVT family DNA-binding domain-containing protein n=1 Tax=Bacillus sp. V3-13 TaxID=2053728 RepID=UPI000C75EBC7|nr:AbrB/MazE/SpoVT family DNA-binding domain-containing protein [Bacillus sp. V3-13]PLR79389.1 AbrB family transcriptional regulator [Bacillus sp. V3-13]
MADKKKVNQKGVTGYSKSYSSTLSSKNQVTIPMTIREATGAEPGDQIIFVLGEDYEVRVEVKKKDSLLSLFGSMPPKEGTKPMEWDAIRKQAREELVSPDN